MHIHTHTLTTCPTSPHIHTYIHTHHTHTIHKHKQDGLRVGRSSPRLPLDWRTIPFLLRATGGPFSPRQSLWALCGVRNPAGDQHAAPTYTPTFEVCFRENVACGIILYWCHTCVQYTYTTHILHMLIHVDHTCAP